MQTSDDIAVYAAIVGTSSLLWQAFTWWRAGPRLSVRLMPQATQWGEGTRDDNSEYVVATITNLGDRPTTLTHVGIETFSSWLSNLRQRPSKTYIVPRPAAPNQPPIPTKLAPGDQWMAIIRRDEGLVDMIAAGRTCVTIYASHAKRRTIARIVK